MAWKNFENIRGPQGEKGDAGTIQAASVATLPAGSAATVQLSGKENVHMHLGLPRGDQGERGPAGSIASASAESLAAGQQAAVVMSGTDEVKHAHFKIPVGLPGAEAIPTGEAIAEHLGSALSPARPGLESGMSQIAGDPESEFSQGMLETFAPFFQAKADHAYVEAGLATAFLRPTASVRARKFTDNDGEHEYFVVRTHAGAAVPGLVRKAFADDFEKTWTPGTPFAPPRENIELAAERLGAPVIINACGVDESGALRGVQIKDGVLYNDFNPSDKTQAECIGFKADGLAKVYSSRRGATGAQMIAEGIVSSFGFGPILVEDGVPADISSSFWGAGWNSQLSGRTILGQTAQGDIVTIAVPGKTGESGIKGDSIVNLAMEEGCVNAVALDGGGSVQAVTGGDRVIFSSDASGNRSLADFLVLDATLANEVSRTVVLEPNVGHLTGPITLRRRGNQIEVSVFLNGSLPENSTVQIYAGLPREFWPAVTNTSVRGMCYFGGGRIGALNVQASGNVSITIPPGLGEVQNPSASATYTMRKAA